MEITENAIKLFEALISTFFNFAKAGFHHIFHYSGFYLAVIASLSFYIGFNEFILKRKPFVIIEALKFEKVDNTRFQIKAIVSNPGNYPISATIAKVVLTVNGQVREGANPVKFILAPDSKFNKEVSIGFVDNINQDTQVITRIEISSMPVDERKIKCVSIGEYKITNTNGQIGYSIVNEEINTQP